tara:strand:- start:2530 stop:3165 length:636 start_codon:yes stop_codon:yes gene_type:complete
MSSAASLVARAPCASARADARRAPAAPRAVAAACSPRSASATLGTSTSSSSSSSSSFSVARVLRGGARARRGSILRAAVDADAAEALVATTEEAEAEAEAEDGEAAATSSDDVPPDKMKTVPSSAVERDLATEVNSRRTFAIISHPDAGKTTLTEKLLYYGGAIQEAGAVRARRGAKAATSDWMEMEKQRGAFCSSRRSPYDRVRVVNFIP